MEQLPLNLSLTQNKALNQDKTTALRSLSLVQGESYDVLLSLFSGQSQVAPTLSDFAFYLRNLAGNNYVSANSIVQSGSGYHFTLPLTSPALNSTPSYKGYFSFLADGTVEIIEPFAINVAPNISTSGAAGAYVSSLNGLTSDIFLSGSGTTSVSQLGQTVLISSSGGGDFYLNSNPSGFLNSDALTPYALASALAASGNALQSQLTALEDASSSYLTAIPSDVVRTSGNQTVSGSKTFTNEIFAPSGVSGSHFFGDGSTLSGVVNTTGNQTIDGAKTFTAKADFSSQGIKAIALFDNSNVAAIQPFSHTLNGPWAIHNQFVAGSFTVQGSLAPVVAPVAGTPATVIMDGDSIPWASIADGDTMSINVNGVTLTFEFDTDGAVSAGIQVDISSAGGNSLAIRDTFATVISSHFVGAATASSASSGIYMSTDSIGSSQVINCGGTLGGTPVSLNSSGTDAVPGSGNDNILLMPGLPDVGIYVDDVYVNCQTDGGNWNTADIELGYWDGTNFERVFLIPQSSLLAGSIAVKNNQFTIPDTTALTAWLTPPISTSLYARMSQSGAQGEEPAGACTVFVLVRGHVY